ncbi:MBL fold metallo-hydrolase [Saliphagus infecundisoli]|uniref:MBL fold metallo-hydrolase n=1 Tax=Saliphagus infecundisoli TaxID=1849069 RepID=A0ABD5QFR8_9EURY|nr:MBL fold metallo-hydrolase [Saliphagus infecundisoli]
MERVTLGNEEFEGRNDAYLLDDEGVALVDTGIATAETESELREGLAEYGHEFADIETIVLTHWHPDHAGLAGAIQAESGARVLVHASDAPLVRRDDEALAEFDSLRREAFEAWGMPTDERESLLAFLDGSEAIAGEPATVEEIADGDRLAVGGRTLETVHAPGHTAGLCLFEFETADGREAFVGDAVLPVYTPNVGGADVRVERPLANYLDTLRTVVERDYDRLWPGHRDPIDDPAGRARTIAEHHRERTSRVLDVLREHGPADAWTVGAHLFGDLEGIHVMHGPGEAFAHLDHLRHEGIVREVEGKYETTGKEADLESLVPVPE